VLALAVAVISSSNAIAPHAGESTFPEDGDLNRVDARGPPPLWVTSDFWVPMPPADTLPNAVFIDDPTVASDKRLDGWFLNLFERCAKVCERPAEKLSLPEERATCLP